MNHPLTASRRQLSLRMLCAAAWIGAARADGPTPPAPATPATSTENLVRLMVDRSVITREQGDALIAQARIEAQSARIAAEAAKPPAPAGTDAPKDGVVRVQHVPESVKAQLREDIRQEVMAKARAENWAQPDAVPEWTRRFRLSGDIRVRHESRMYPSGNDTSGAFPDFNAINHGAPYDASASNPNFAPQRNADQARDRMRLRVRVAGDLDLGEDFTAGIRVATGHNDSPVSANQTFGLNGGFTKYAIWLDRGFIRYATAKPDGAGLTLTAGRFDNPFFSTQMIWDEDVGFDGLCARIDAKVNDKVSVFGTAGLFPIFNTNLNFAANQPAKYKSEDKWLHAGQLGVKIKATKSTDFKLAAAYYAFENVEGRLSDPYVPLSDEDVGSTDALRPGFAQSGNTYMALRNITPDASNGFGTTNQFQYYGLVSPFRVGTLTGRADYAGFDPVHLSFTGEAVKNFAFDSGSAGAIAVNNLKNGRFKGGDMGYEGNLNVGAATLEARGDWIVGVGYRYVESDAVMDAFANSDLGNGGTNLKGYILSGSVALSHRVFVQARWFSAESIAGPRFKADSVFLDITARF